MVYSSSTNALLGEVSQYYTPDTLQKSLEEDFEESDIEM
jgi:hypothetical protein